METNITIPANQTWVDTGVDVSKGQVLKITALGEVWALCGNNTYRSTPDGGSASFSHLCTMRLPSAAPMSLIGKIGSGGASFFVGSNYEEHQTGTGRLYLETNDCPGSHGDNCGSFEATITIAPSNEGPADCPFCYASQDHQSGFDPISLWGGEKREQVTDLSVNTPAGALAFTRSYRQNKQADFTTPLGLGWTHNHHLVLDDQGSTILLQMPSGGIAHFTLDTGGIYIGDPGSNSQIDANGGEDDMYTLTASDESVWVFDDQKRIRSRTWPTGEVWSYDYYVIADGVDLDGKLKQVNDGYNRALQFTYIRDTDPNVFKRRQLWRVGDHMASGLDGTTPTGRYIELDYVSEKGRWH